MIMYLVIAVSMAGVGFLGSALVSQAKTSDLRAAYRTLARAVADFLERNHQPLARDRLGQVPVPQRHLRELERALEESGRVQM